MQRRDVLALFGITLVGCGGEPAGPPAGDAGSDPLPPDTFAPDACAGATVILHDTHAQALYLDGTNGPLTGVIRVSDVVANQTLTLEFWHGHGGVPHRFTLEPAHFAMLRAGLKVTLGTTTVDGHAHTLFIDPTNEQYRVPGAPDVMVPLPC